MLRKRRNADLGKCGGRNFAMLVCQSDHDHVPLGGTIRRIIQGLERHPSDRQRRYELALGKTADASVFSLETGA
jgi:hypothetical protein